MGVQLVHFNVQQRYVKFKSFLFNYQVICYSKKKKKSYFLLKKIKKISCYMKKKKLLILIIKNSL